MKQKETKRIPIEKIILGTIGTVGILSIVAIAPGIGPALKLFDRRKKYSEKNVQNALYRMKQKGLIVFEERNGHTYVVLTKEGKDKLEHIRRNEYKIEAPRTWDGRWRIVIFDIKEARRSVRDQLRKELLQVGFVKLQNSVWIYPYECEEFIKLVKADHRIGKDILYIVAEKVEYDKNFKHRFNL